MDSIMRKMIELLSLRKWDPKFDFRSLRYIFRHNPSWKPGQYSLNPILNISQPKGKLKVPIYEFRAPVFHLNVRKDTKGSTGFEMWPEVKLRDTAYTEDGIDALTDVPPHWGIRYAVQKDEKKHAGLSILVETMTKFINYFAWTFFGYVSTPDSLSLSLRESGNAAPSM
jgi:hypothetical protein